MQIRGLDAESVDHLVAKFYASMLKSMHATMNAVTHSFSLVAAGGVSEPEPGAISAYDNLSTIQVTWAAQVADTLKPELMAIFSKAGSTVASQLETLDLTHGVLPGWNDDAVAHMNQAVNRVVAFSDEMWSTAKQQLTLGMQDGDGIAELADRVKAVTGIKEKKAHVIAQTEVIAAVNGGEWTQMRASAAAFDLVMTKEWHATEDSHTRPTHAAADGQIVSLDQSFTVGTAHLQFPGDPTGQPAEIISCRCTMLYEFDESGQIEPSETSPDAQTASAPVAITAAFDAAEHPRGKNGKFIKKGVDLPGTIFEILAIAKKLNNAHGGDTHLGDSFTDTEKKNFTGVVANQLTQSQWNNLKDDDKGVIHKIVEDALDSGAPGSADAVLQLEEFDANDDGGPVDVDEQDLGSSGPDEGMDFEGDEPGEVGAKFNAPDDQEYVTDKIFDAKKNGDITQDQYIELGNMLMDGESNDTVQKKLDQFTKKSTPEISIPKTTIAKATPIKMTHGLIHAKHTPGETIAQTSDGKTKVVWDGKAYKVDDKTVIKSKLYAYLAKEHSNAHWVKPGKQDVTVDKPSINEPSIVGPHAKKLPENKIFTGDKLGDKLDEAFGTPALTPPAWGAYPGEPGHDEDASPLTTSNVAQKLDMSSWVQTAGNQGGYNQGGIFEAPNGDKYYVKSLANQNALRSEVLAAHLYEAAGVKVPEVHFVNPFTAPTGWQNVVASKIVEGKNAKSKLITDAVFQAKVQDGFAVDAWLSNWDAVGSGDVKYSNIIDVNGEPVHIDVGGSLEVGGTGIKKSGKFSPDKVDELQTFFNGTNQELKTVFGGMSETQKKESVKKHLLPMTNAKIDKLVTDAGMPPSIATTLKKRRDIILNHFGFSPNVITDLHPPDATPNVEISAPDVSSSAPTSGISHIPYNSKADFYDLFKAEKVSPAWSGAKIWNSLHAAQVKMSGDSKIAQLTPAQMLQIVDQKHGKGGTPYADKVSQWLTTPAGKKAALLAKSTGLPAVPASPIKKATKATTPSATALPKITAADVLGDPSTTGITVATKNEVFTSFKDHSAGSYAKASPDVVFKHATKVAAQHNLSVHQTLKIVDEKNATKLNIPNSNLFEKKVATWANTVATVEELLGKPKKAAPTGPVGVTTPGAKHVLPANIPGASLKSFDASKPESDFKIIDTYTATNLWSQMQASSPQGVLKPTQKSALKKYTGSDFVPMNNYLRKSGDSSSTADSTKNAVKNAQNGMRPSTQDLMLHRGNGWFSGWSSVEDAKNNVGKTMHQKAFFSTSVGGTPGYGAGQSIRFEIEAPKGTPMAYVADFSASGHDEREMILAAGLRYQVISTRQPSSSENLPGGVKVIVRLRVIAEGGTA